MVSSVTIRSDDEALTIQIDDLLIHRMAHEVRVKGVRVKFTRKEFRLLVALASNPEKVFGRDELLSLAWGGEVTVDRRTVDVHVARLRRLLTAHHLTSPTIETVWGVGYRLRPRG